VVAGEVEEKTHFLGRFGPKSCGSRENQEENVQEPEVEAPFSGLNKRHGGFFSLKGYELMEKDESVEYIALLEGNVKGGMGINKMHYIIIYIIQ
jgi:hypothetical protein